MDENQTTLFDDTPDNEECELVYGDIDTVVYLLKMDNDTVKIGITDSIKKRIPAIEHASGNFVLEGYHTKKFYNTVAREIESLMHEWFAQYRKVGEYFYITLDAAREKLQKHSKLIHFTPKERAIKSAKMVERNFVGDFIDTGEKFVRVPGATVKAKDFIDELKKAYPDECAKFKKQDLIRFIQNVGGVEYTFDRKSFRVFKGIGKLGNDFDGEPVAPDDKLY